MIQFVTALSNYKAKKISNNKYNRKPQPFSFYQILKNSKNGWESAALSSTKITGLKISISN